MSQTRAIPPYLMRDGVEPSAGLRGIRESAAVQETFTAFGTPAYLVTRYPDIRAVLADHERFSNRRTGTFGVSAEQNGIDAHDPPGALLATDPPQHHRLRRMLAWQWFLARTRGERSDHGNYHAETNRDSGRECAGICVMKGTSEGMR